MIRIWYERIFVPENIRIYSNIRIFATPWYISLSFYVCRGQNEHFSINSVRKKGRIEPFQIFDPYKLCWDFCKTIFVILKVQFHHEDSLRRRRYFELFFFSWFILLSQKKSAPSGPIFTLFWLFVIISLIF